MILGARANQEGGRPPQVHGLGQSLTNRLWRVSDGFFVDTSKNY